MAQSGKPGCCADGGTFVVTAMLFVARKVGQAWAPLVHFVTLMKPAPGATLAIVV